MEHVAVWGFLVLISLLFVAAATGSRVPKAPGPNMCMVQQVHGTKDKFFTNCVAKHLQMICERPTVVRWDCCSGFERESGTQGCTKEKPLGNLLETTKLLGLSTYHLLAVRNNMTDMLQNQGAYTVFAPSDEAFKQASKYEWARINPMDGSESLLLYHLAPGKLPIDTFLARNQQFVTMYQDKKVRVSKYAYGVATVNCARIIRPDEKATNGFVHVIDKVIKPLDLQGSLAERIFADDNYTQFQLALFVSDLARQLQQEDGEGGQGQEYTVLAPTNQAFSRLPNDLLARILTDATTAEKVLRRHIVKGVYCGDGIVVSVGLKTLDEGRVLFRCTRDGLRTNQAKVVRPDTLASNGVIHGIDQVLLPDSVREPSDLLEDLQVKKFLQLAKRAGLEHKLNNVTNVTIFAPTDAAFDSLPSGARAALTNEPLAMSRLLDYHIAKGKLTDNRIVGDLEMDTGLAVKLKVHVYRNGVAIDTAKAVSPIRECDKASVQKIDKVLVPVEDNLMDLISKDKDLSIFQQALETSGLSELLAKDGRYTVLAPSNRAFSYLDQRRLDQLMNNPVRLEKFVGRHVINRLVVKCEIPESSTYGIQSRQGDLTVFNYDTRGNLLLNDLINISGTDKLATNGVLYKIHDVLKCSCERSLTMARGYQHRTRSRQHYHKLRIK